MLHFSCDLCGRELDERRYVVRLETYPAFDPDQLSDADLDVDHLLEVAQQLDQVAPEEAAGIEEQTTKVMRYDLCPHCHGKFLRDPLGREALQRLNFSQN